MEIHPQEIKGAWDHGYVLDKHTISSTMIGYNEFGHPEFDTQRSPLGELVYKLKYKSDKTALSEIVQTVAGFISDWGIKPDVISPLPPSKQRVFQPVIEIAKGLGHALRIPVDTLSLAKVGTTSQMKDIGSYDDRTKVLEAVFAASKEFKGRKILLIDDLFQSGATMNVAARIIRKQGEASEIYALALTRTRG
jgi:predicted amidophosphoribosyltransferase